jgi:hypothetical protein
MLRDSVQFAPQSGGGQAGILASAGLCRLFNSRVESSIVGHIIDGNIVVTYPYTNKSAHDVKKGVLLSIRGLGLPS